jgi:hypothetical protein
VCTGTAENFNSWCMHFQSERIFTFQIYFKWENLNKEYFLDTPILPNIFVRRVAMNDQSSVVNLSNLSNSVVDQ